MISPEEYEKAGKGKVHTVDPDVFQDEDDLGEFQTMLEEAKAAGKKKEPEKPAE